MKLISEKIAQRWTAWLTANEARVIIAWAALLLALNLGTATLYPTSWSDEAMFSDPAINFAQGKGFTSTAWWQSKQLVWSGNVPLYTGVLVLWVKAFGVGLVKTRAFNYCVISLVIPVFWSGIKRLGCIPSAAARIGLVMTAFMTFPLCFAYRSARTDCLGMLICAWALWAWSSPNRTVRNASLFLAGVLAPVSGLQLIGYYGLLCLLVWLWEGKAAVSRLCFLGAGMVAGALALLLYYYCHHLTGVFATLEEARRLHEAAVRAGGEGTGFTRILVKARRIVSHQLGEYGITPTLAALLVLAMGRQVRSDGKLRRLAVIAVCASFALVGTLEVTLHYLAYYHWMNYIILAVTLFILLSRTWPVTHPLMKAVVVMLIAVSALAGLPLRLFTGAALGQSREFAQMESLVEKNVTPTDVVFSDYMGYFPVKARAREIYLPAYFRVMTEEERRSVNVLILDPINYEGYSAQFVKEGRWRKVGGFSSEVGPMGKWVLRLMPNYMKQPTSCGYSITILRREAEAP